MKWVSAKEKWQCSAAGKVSVGLAAQRPCVTDCGISIYKLNRLRKDDEHPSYTPEWSIAHSAITWSSEGATEVSKVLACCHGYSCVMSNMVPSDADQSHRVSQCQSATYTLFKHSKSQTACIIIFPNPFLRSTILPSALWTRDLREKWVKVIRPTWHKTGHFRYVLSS